MLEALRAVDGGTVISLRVVPGASRAGIAAVGGAEVRVRVCSPPVGGRANAEVCEVVAEVLGLRPRQVALVGGAMSRGKQVRVELDPDAVERRLAAALRR